MSDPQHTPFGDPRAIKRWATLLAEDPKMKAYFWKKFRPMTRWERVKRWVTHWLLHGAPPPSPPPEVRIAFDLSKEVPK